MLSKVLSKSTVNTVHEAMVLMEEYPWQTLNSQNSSALLVSTLRNQHHTRFVYRLGHQVFNLRRGVQLPYRVPDLITLVTKPVGNSDSE